MEQSKANPITFPEALRSIKATTGRTEASSASELVATLDPSEAVIDRFAVSNFGLSLVQLAIIFRKSAGAKRRRVILARRPPLGANALIVLLQVAPGIGA
jgi:hypothetical protein